MTQGFFRRLLIKVSGERLANSSGPFSDQFILPFLVQVEAIHRLGAQVALLVGGGNIYRGRLNFVEREWGDWMGMYSTLINGLFLKSLCQKLGLSVVLQSALAAGAPFQDLDAETARETLEAGKIVIFCGGVGRPFFSTDTAAVLRALDIHADLVLKATKVGGIYDQDPVHFPNAVKFDRISFDEILRRNLQVMDAEAFCLCRQHRLPLQVFSMDEKDALVRIFRGEAVGTLARDRFEKDTEKSSGDVKTIEKQTELTSI